MFNLKKVNKARKRLEIVTSILFKLFQINLRYKEKRDDYGIEIFEYFYLPWRSDKTFKEVHAKFSDYTLNPKSRLYTIYDFSKIYLTDNTSFIEVGSWRGGVSGLVASTNFEKNIDYFVCDTFQGVANSSDKDSFFKNNEYADAEVSHLKEVETIAGAKFNIIQGVFPGSMENIFIEKPISFAHIDVDTYISAKESFDFIMQNAAKNALVILDDYGGWFTDGVTKFGNELKSDKRYFVVPNHLGQVLIYKID